MSDRIYEFEDVPTPSASRLAEKIPIREAMRKATWNGAEFLDREIPKRELLIGDWFCESDLGFIFAPRGVGKTWFAYLIIASLTTGKKLGNWEIASKRKVMLVDGEMPLDDVQERLNFLEIGGENLMTLSHQDLFDTANQSFQIGDQENRDALLMVCVENNIQVVVIDNLSSISDIKENDNDDWQQIGDWLLEFRRRGISVIVVHHAGRNGQMRGASRREDAAFWVVKLSESKQRAQTENGARFVSTFTKSRNSRRYPDSVDWHLTEDESGKLVLGVNNADNSTLVLAAIHSGIDQCSQIAEEVGLNKSTVSKLAKKLQSNGLVRIEGNGNQSRYLPS